MALEVVTQIDDCFKCDKTYWILTTHFNLKTFVCLYNSYSAMIYFHYIFTQVNLGVLMENENTTEGIYKIMHHLHQYVPGHGSDKVIPIISAGDLLTCERESSCKAEQQNSTTPSTHLEGLVPVIGDFHALGNFYQVHDARKYKFVQFLFFPLCSLSTCIYPGIGHTHTHTHTCF